MTRLLLAVLSWLVPASERPRWREEWLAEMHTIREECGRRTALRATAGAIPDAWALRRLTATAERQPRRPFLGLNQDIRYGVRGILGARSYAIGIIGSLGIGIAATAAAFSVVNATFLKPFPGVRDQHELVRVDVRTGQFFIGSSYDEYLLLQKNLPSVNGLAASVQAEFAISIGTETLVTSGAIVSGDYFDVLGLRPALGRGFAPDEDAAPWQKPAVIVSHDFWTRRLGADPGAVNRTLVVNGADLAIVGVAPKDFVGVHSTSHRNDLWTTFATSDLALRDREGRPVHIRDQNSPRSPTSADGRRPQCSRRSRRKPRRWRPRSTACVRRSSKTPSSRSRASR